ncbi:MAG TPA: bifunctional (p)ppGpp synthetase/guanosine-3',5'-bis(diphosphate) 3'-pyrophosphohydrolase [Candidatus Gallibacteroides avistercoris]|uniref:Bifunctional (P)ppGpp synthetase/guanosine-3',5'-bis(Diphosphate) 3'-pyrophosphohydrolase n=1 Tax=Candidatus Gallibacteroides avistercoris TaxID=2840833 RepID=A0A9D1M6I3_9BACT|nr:bifunctional (p)ppGpp synthetase/guanosine-3',5'-bis(diphosphate) 3'-pyrophosphohydrolase [Candidatus Gallibacteroides avistercoris]
MEDTVFLTEDEHTVFLDSYKVLVRLSNEIISWDERNRIKAMIQNAMENGVYLRDKNGLSLLLRNVQTAMILSKEVGLERSMLIAVLLYHLVEKEVLSAQNIQSEFGEDVVSIIRRLLKANSLYSRHAAIDSENFRKLLLTFAEDVRVIIIMIADRLCLMRMINHHPDEKFRTDVAFEASYLYAPLAHRLGLYKIKSELEDLSLKYTNRETFTQIARKLKETKRSRDQYINAFIEPVKRKIEETGWEFDIKGRTKSIYSIWNKMKKQQTDIENIYDLFAIRVILDVPLEQEKAACWQVYSIITDMYQPNPKRMKDWLSIPKSNGYESLHITVLGPQNRWVEVQIRTKRMDEIAEHGLAAHWKYKGVKSSESGLDDWLNNVREVLDSADSGPMELMKEFKMDLYDKEVFVFTPKGDLYKLPKGATVLDFAFLIHSGLGCKCVGARVNGKNQTIRYQVKSGDTIEILTAPAQTPKRDWLNIVSTSKARVKIKQSLKELELKESEFGKELLQRRFKNRKIEVDEALLMRFIKKKGYKTVTDFYYALASEKLDVNDAIDQYVELGRKENPETVEQRTAENFVVRSEEVSDKEDVLVIDQNLKDVEYKLAKCCNPIYGDEIFGFVSTQGSIKIHRTDCPNAAQMRARFGYRVVKARWSGKQGSQYTAVLRVVGHDDIGIVTNITSIISKEKKVSLRTINIDSTDGLFQGHISVLVEDISALESLIRKIRTVKGVKSVERSKT